MQVLGGNRKASLSSRASRILFGILGLVLLAVPYVGVSSYVVRMFTLTLMYISLGLSLNLLSGLAGQVSLGHAAFYGIGAYTSALLSLRLGLPFMLTCLAGGIMASLLGLLLCFPAMKLQGTYFTFVTLGFGEIVRLIILNWAKLTRGPMGLPGIPQPVILGIRIASDGAYYYLILVIAVIIYAVVSNISNSATGRALVAIREDTLVAEAMGVNVFKYKMIAFGLSTFFAGIVGAYFAHYISFIDPSNFTFDESSLILSLVVLGGMGNLKGTILAACFLIAVPEVMRGLLAYRMLIYGLILVLAMMIRPQGLLGSQKRMQVS
ncbi:MAG TPA: branched-chain amino acid ABC transporter permease [Firmicutes bacterium]|jgi:branched-chain amino acid transport system permease protein|nr:branched-chain amino acid ABC transporter permease [Bacillota bacterium]